MFIKKRCIALLVLGLVFILAGCRDEESIKVMVPNGAPSLSQSHIQYHNDSKYTIEIVDGADPLAAAFVSETHDIIFAPTNLGARLISLGAPYQFASAISFGNFYLATAREDITSFSDLEGETITLFGQNTTGDAIINTLINSYNFDDEPTLIYVGSVQEAMATLLQDNNAIVLLAEPVLTMAKDRVDNLSTVDVQAEWETFSGQDSYPQAGVFVHKNLDSSAIDDYLNALEEGIDLLTNETERVAHYTEALDYPFDKDLIESAFSGMNIRFETSAEARESLELYFTMLLEFNPALINNALPSDSFYYHTD